MSKLILPNVFIGVVKTPLRILFVLQCVLISVDQSPYVLISASSNYGGSSSGGGGASGSGGGGGYYHGGRHSYSLTTFDPSGNLDQVVRAMRASNLGVPIVALSIPPTTCSSSSSSSSSAISSSLSSSSSLTTSSSLYAASVASSTLALNHGEGGSSRQGSSRQGSFHEDSLNRNLTAAGGIHAVIPLRFLSSSPLMVDDGTPRCVPITSSIFILHTGVGADGRALCDKAVEMALNHKYLYGMELSSQELLEGLSDIMQEATMKRGTRPYGSSLLVGCLEAETTYYPAMYRVDPSGAVELLTPLPSSSSSTGYHLSHTISNNHLEEETTTKRIAPSLAFLGNWNTLGKNKKHVVRNQLLHQHFSTMQQVEEALVGIAKQSFFMSKDNNSLPSDNTDKGDDSTALVTTRPRERRSVLYVSLTHQRGLQITIR